MSKEKFTVGDTVVCLMSARNNSDVIVGQKYEVSEVDTDGMIKLKEHPDFWSPERFMVISKSKINDNRDSAIYR